jgi:hypothetical protein
MLRTSFLGKSSMRRVWDDREGMNPLEMTPINEANQKMNQVLSLLLTKKTDKFEDTLVTRHLYNKLYIILMTRALVHLMLTFLSTTYYELDDPRIKAVYSAKLIINIWITLFSILSVFLYIYSLIIEGNYLKNLSFMSENTNPLSYFGFHYIIPYSFLMLLHQIYEGGDRNVLFSEIYWAGEKIYFHRNLNNYFTIIQFSVHYFTFLHIMLRMTHWGNAQVHRICRISNTENNFLFICKSFLSEIPLYFTTGIALTLLLYFTVIIRFIETGFQRTLRYTDFENETDFFEEWINRSYFETYKNCYWNVFITMATIGYGEFNVYSTFSRIVLFFITVSGMASTSTMIVAYLNFLEFEDMQNFAYNFFNALELKLKMKENVAKALNSYVKMLFSCKKNAYKNYHNYRLLTIKYMDDYKIQRNYYYNLYGPSDTDIVGISLIKLDNYLDGMSLKIYKENKNARIKAHKFNNNNKKIFKVLFSPITNPFLKPIEEENELEIMSKKSDYRSGKSDKSKSENSEYSQNSDKEDFDNYLDF